jgi:hypothetical protein
MKLYIAVLDEFPDYMTPTLVAHSVLSYHLKVVNLNSETEKHAELIKAYQFWCKHDYRKVVLKVNSKEFEKIAQLPFVYLGHENKTLEGKEACAVWLSKDDQLDVPNVLKYAKLWKPK